MKAEIALNVTESILRLAEWVLILKNPEGMYLFELSINIINVEVKCSKSTSGAMKNLALQGWLWGC